MTVLYTTHYMEEVEEISDRIVIMDHGKIIASGTKEQLKENLSKERQYIIELNHNQSVDLDAFYKIIGIQEVMSGAAGRERGLAAMDSVREYLYTPYGLMLNAPAYSKPDDEIGFVTRVYKGLKENGSIFSHPNPWAWAAECVLGRGDRAMEFYDALGPYWQNDNIEVRKAEP